MKHLKLFKKFESKQENVIEEVAQKFIELGFIDSDSVDIEEDHFEITSIKGKQFAYFLENSLIVEADKDIEGEVTVIIRGEDYGDDIDQKEKEEVYHWINNNWHTSNYPIYFDDTDDEDLM
jgi:hypothetical protein